MMKKRIIEIIYRNKQELVRGVLLLTMIFITIMIARIFGEAVSYFGSLGTIIRNAAPYVPLALGVAIVISCGEIDLSVAGLFSFCGMLTLGLGVLHLHMLFVYVLVLAIALVEGIVIGILVTRRRVPSLILTLGASFFLYGLSFVIDHILRKAAKPRILTQSRSWLIFENWEVWIVGIIFILFLIRKFSVHWKYHIASGLDKRAALLAALPIDRVKVIAFAASALLCYISAMLLLFFYNSGGWDVGTGKGKELTAIAAAVIGGTRITGGRLQPCNVVLAVVLWHALLFLTDMIRAVSPHEQELAIGALVIIIAILGERKQ